MGQFKEFLKEDKKPKGFKLKYKFKRVGGDFDCHDLGLISLDGCPEKVGWGFYCHNNQLTSLEGAPKEVGGYFSCFNNRLTSLEGAPKEVGGHFYCHNNPGPNGNGFTEEDIRKICKVKGKIII